MSAVPAPKPVRRRRWAISARSVGMRAACPVRVRGRSGRRTDRRPVSSYPSAILTGTTRGGAMTPPDRSAIDQLRKQVDGPVLAAGEPGLPEEVAGFQLAVTHQPAVAVGATSVADVVAA